MRKIKIIISFCAIISGVSAQGKIFLHQSNELPWLTVFSPVKNNGMAVVVCSGGSYEGRANGNEGIPASQKLAEAGFTAFLLDYHTPAQLDTIDKYKITFGDLQRAIAYVRDNKKKYKVKTGMVGIMGFSAGGHLVTTIATHFKTDYAGILTGKNLRPDFLIAVYPVVSLADSITHKSSRYHLLGDKLTAKLIIEFSNELQVTTNTPPTYLVSAVDDEAVPVENSLFFAAALRQQHVPVELWLYAKGGHGFGINNMSYSAQWIDDCIKWIRKLDLKK